MKQQQQQQYNNSEATATASTTMKKESIDVAALMQPILEVICLSDDGSRRFLKFFSRCKTEKSLWNRLGMYLSYDEQTSSDALEIYELDRPDKFDLRTFREWYQRSKLPPDFQWANFDDDIYCGGSPRIHSDELVSLSASIPTPILAPMSMVVLAAAAGQEPQQRTIDPNVLRTCMRNPKCIDAGGAKKEEEADETAGLCKIETGIVEVWERENRCGATAALCNRAADPIPAPVLSTDASSVRPDLVMSAAAMEPANNTDADLVHPKSGPEPVAVPPSPKLSLVRAVSNSPVVPDCPISISTAIPTSKATSKPKPQIRVRNTRIRIPVKKQPTPADTPRRAKEESKPTAESSKRSRADSDLQSSPPPESPCCSRASDQQTSCSHDTKTNTSTKRHCSSASKAKRLSNPTPSLPKMSIPIQHANNPESQFLNQIAAANNCTAGSLRGAGQTVASRRVSDAPALKPLLPSLREMDNKQATPSNPIVDDDDDDDGGDDASSHNTPPPTDPWFDEDSGASSSPTPSTSTSPGRAPSTPLPAVTPRHVSQQHSPQRQHHDCNLQHRWQPSPPRCTEGSTRREPSLQHALPTPRTSTRDRDSHRADQSRSVGNASTQSKDDHAYRRRSSRSSGKSGRGKYTVSARDLQDVMRHSHAMSAEDYQKCGDLASDLLSTHISSNGEGLRYMRPNDIAVEPKHKHKSWFQLSDHSREHVFGKDQIPSRYKVQGFIATSLFGHNFVNAPFHDSQISDRFTANSILNGVTSFNPRDKVASLRAKFQNILSTMKTRRRLDLFCGETEVVVFVHCRPNGRKVPYLFVLLPIQRGAIWVGTPSHNPGKPMTVLRFRWEENYC